MSQKVIAKQMSLESASDPIAVKATVETVPAEAVAVESYADRLMDELFEGVDRAFDGSAGQPSPWRQNLWRSSRSRYLK